MARIELKNIQKDWAGVIGVKDVDLDIADQEFLVLLGPSGCGKTTTMRMIAGLEHPSSGTITMDGQIVNDVEARDRDVAMVFQGYALYPNMTIYENVRFPLRMRQVPKNEHDQKIRAAAEMVELTDYLERKPSALSGGQRQRAALARAIVREPRLFLMDEPLSNLDAKLRQSMRVQIKHIQRQLGITTIYVTHDQIEAMTLADRIVIMQAGRIQQIGTPDQIYNDPANIFVAGFIGSPPMNLIEGDLKDGTFCAPGIRVDGLPATYKGQIYLGVRPEDCEITDNAEHLRGEVFGVEPTGDMTYLTLRAGDKMIEIKANRDYRAPLGSDERVNFDTERLYLFDFETGERLR